MCMVTFGWGETDAKEKVNKFEKTSSLSWAVVELTNLCNFNCMWCYASSGFNNQYMTKENAEKLVQILADAGIKQVTCSGGEPLMYPFIKDFIKDANDYGMIIHMNTNGYFLTKKLAKELHDLGLTQVQINIDSLNPEIHDRVRGKKGSFNKAIQALKNARDAGLICVSQTVLTKQNENEIIDIFKFARSIGMQRCRVWDITMTGRATEKIDLRPSDYIETLKKLAEFASKTGAKNIESGDPLFPLSYKTKLDVFGGYCAAIAGLYFTISYNGEVHSCAAIRKSIYNIFKIMKNNENLSEFHNFKLKEYMKSFKIPTKCEKCTYLKKCKGGCLARRNHLKFTDYYCFLNT